MIGDFEPQAVFAPTEGLANVSPGWVFWITGLAGAGKTTIGSRVFERIRATHPNSVFLDGDQVREALGGDLGYSLEDREVCSRRYSGLCRLLSLQGLHVVIATISMFASCREWNRRHIPKYFEVYLRVPDEVLFSRKPGGLYGPNKGQCEGPVWGVDLVSEEPQDSDIIVDNDGTLTPDAITGRLWLRIQPLLGESLR